MENVAESVNFCFEEVVSFDYFLKDFYVFLFSDLVVWGYPNGLEIIFHQYYQFSTKINAKCSQHQKLHSYKWVAIFSSKVFQLKVSANNSSNKTLWDLWRNEKL